MTENKPRASAAGWLVVLCVFLSAVYLALPTAHHSYDAVAYALDVEYAVVTGSFERVWHDYHILYDPLVYALHALGRPAGLHPLMTMQIVNALAGALVATLLAALLHARTRSRLLAACGGLALGLCGSFWYYSTNAEPYVVSVLCLLGFLAWLPLDEEMPHPARKLVLSAVAFGLAVGFHLSAIVLAPVAVLFLLLSRPHSPGLRRAALFTAVAGTLIAVPYVYKWYHVSRADALSGFEGIWTDFFTPTNPVNDPYFLARPYSPAAEYLGLLRGFAPPAVGGGGAVLQAALYVFPVALTCLALAGAWRAFRSGRRKELLPIACFLTMLLFFASYNLGDMKFTVFLAFFLVTAAILSLGDLAAAFPGARPWLWLLPLLVVVLGAGNFVRFIHPWSMDESNPDLLEALLIRESTGPNDGVMLIGRGDRNNLKVYVPYFGEREVIILDFLFNSGVLPREESFARVRRRIETIEARGGTLWAIADIVEKGRDTRWFLLRNALTAHDLDELLAGLDAGPVVRRDGVPLIYPLRRSIKAPRATGSGDGVRRCRATSRFPVSMTLDRPIPDQSEDVAPKGRDGINQGRFIEQLDGADVPRPAVASLDPCGQLVHSRVEQPLDRRGRGRYPGRALVGTDREFLECRTVAAQKRHFQDSVRQAPVG